MPKLRRDVEMDDYSRDVSRYPLLTREEERAVGRALRSKHPRERRAAFEALVRSNLRFVIAVARTFMGHTLIPLIDLVQVGNIGLMKAARRFDYRKGFRFCTYAQRQIKWSIEAAVFGEGRLVRFPDNTELLVRAIHAADMLFKGRHGRAPTAAELYGVLVPQLQPWMRKWINRDDFPYYVHVARGIAQTPFFLGLLQDAEGDSAHEVDFEQFVREDFTSRVPSPVEGASAAERRSLIMQALGDLPRRERVVLLHRFGLVKNGRERGLKEVGGMLQLSRERIRQIEAEALERLSDNPRLRELAAELAAQS